ncbi:hypothetical protein AVEN_201525-1 [Araneus ventricosus]|uniref:Uncharacterized protein n=1 Tax=Araneus ventricosus TaxID=182803 RepID=A0A4Y2P221_ARAVE|nr:hypothetical protein AVEN_201525-1 [Araneus ventricosus]
MIDEDLQKFSESRVMRTIAIGRLPIRNLPKMNAETTQKKYLHLADIDAAARQNVNKPEASSINASQNANLSRVLHEITTPHASGEPIMNEIPLSTFTGLPVMLANMNDVMALLVQFFSQLLEDKGPLSLSAFSTPSLIRTRSTLSSLDFHDNLPTYEEPKCVNQRFSQHIGSSKLSEIYKKPTPQTR